MPSRLRDGIEEQESDVRTEILQPSPMPSMLMAAEEVAAAAAAVVVGIGMSIASMMA